MSTNENENIWASAETAWAAGFRAVTAERSGVTAEEMAPLCEIADAVAAEIDAGTATRATVLGAVIERVRGRISFASAISDRFETDLGQMVAMPKMLAYSCLRAWWAGACAAVPTEILCTDVFGPADPAERVPAEVPAEVVVPEVVPAEVVVPEVVPAEVVVPEVVPAEVVAEVPAEVPAEVVVPEVVPAEVVVPEVVPAEVVTEVPAEVVVPEVVPAEVVVPEVVPAEVVVPEVVPAEVVVPEVVPAEVPAEVPDALSVAMASAPETVDDVYRNCVWLALAFDRLGTQRTADVTVRTREGSDATAKTRTTKQILSDCDECKAVLNADTAFRVKIREMAIPAKIVGIYPIPVASMATVESLVEAYEAERAELVGRFVETYETAVAADRARLEADGTWGLWDANDYPPKAEVAATYKMRATWKDLSASTKITTAMSARNARAAQEEQRAAFAEVRAGLRVAMGTVLDSLVEALRPGADGTLKSFKDSRVIKLSDWLNGFGNRDVTSDLELQRLVADARAVLAGVPNGDILRKDSSMRLAVAGKLEAVQAGLETLGVVDAPKRQMRRKKA